MKKEPIFSIRSEQVEDLRQRLKQHHLLDSNWDLLDGFLIFLFLIRKSGNPLVLNSS